MVVSERTGMRVPTPKEWGDRDDKLHGQNGMNMYRTLPHSQPIGLVQSAYVTSLLRGDSTKLVQHQHFVLYERQNAAACICTDSGSC